MLVLSPRLAPQQLIRSLFSGLNAKTALLTDRLLVVVGAGGGVAGVEDGGTSSLGVGLRHRLLIRLRDAHRRDRHVLVIGVLGRTTNLPVLRTFTSVPAPYVVASVELTTETPALTPTMGRRCRR